MNSTVALMQDESVPNTAAGREPVSAFVICYNEERHIEACLKSLSFCDEIVVIDSFSTDRTVEIAESCGARVIQRAWPGFRDQKAFGLAAVTHEWVINIDADERVSDDLREHILEVLRHVGRQEGNFGETGSAEISGYYISRVVFFLGRWWRLGGWYPEYRLRFFRKSCTVWGGVDPHEKPIVRGRTERLPGEIYHFTYKNLDEQLSRLHRYSTVAAQEEYRLGTKPTLASLLLNPLFRATKFYVLKRGYREGMAGLIVAITEGYYTFMKYAKLWEYTYQGQNKSTRDDEEPA